MNRIFELPCAMKPRTPLFTHLIEPLPGLNAIDFVEGVGRKKGDVKNSLAAERRIWVWSAKPSAG